MTIDKAIKIALENNKCIVIKNGVETKRIKPTVDNNCIFMTADGSTIPRYKYGWQPSAEDLISDDWFVES